MALREMQINSSYLKIGTLKVRIKAIFESTSLSALNSHLILIVITFEFKIARETTSSRDHRQEVTPCVDLPNYTKHPRLTSLVHLKGFFPT